jgi:uncharacterized protein YciU (UPF0263 family)
LVAEGLRRALVEGRRVDSIHRVRIDTVLLPHLLFIDDILLFLNRTEREARKLKEILDIFCVATGMEVNSQKSAYCFYGLREEVEGRLRNLFPSRILICRKAQSIWGSFSSQMAMGKETGVAIRKGIKQEPLLMQ